MEWLAIFETIVYMQVLEQALLQQATHVCPPYQRLLPSNRLPRPLVMWCEVSGPVLRPPHPAGGLPPASTQDGGRGKLRLPTSSWEGPHTGPGVE